MKVSSTKVRSFLEGAGVGVLVTLRFTMYLVSPYHEMLYVHPSPLYRVYLGAIVDLAAIAIIWILARRIKVAVVWAFLWTGIVITGMYDFSLLLDLSISRWAFAATTVSSLACLGLLSLRHVWFRIADRALRSCLVLIGFSGLWMISEMGYIAARSASPETTEFYKTPKVANGATNSRIIWLVFDELSHDQVYEHRWPDLSLPNFDRLRLHSVTFTNVRPAGNYTDKVIPSLFLGKTVSEIKSSVGGDVAVYLKDFQEWHEFNSGETIFAHARQLGWSTGIVGWYIPYCRILADWVDSCWWSNQQPFQDNLSSSHPVWLNAVAPFLNWLQPLTPGIVPERASYWASLADSQARDFQAGLERAEVLVRNPAVRLTYIHLDVPHPPGIYDRKKRIFSRGGSYLDNLALADEALGRLLDVAETNPNWSETTLIVCGDHSWRTPIWKHHAATWTQEDEAASAGRFDTRPLLSIHFPNQETASTFTGSFSALTLHGVIEDLLRGKIGSEAIFLRRQ